MAADTRIPLLVSGAAALAFSLAVFSSPAPSLGRRIDDFAAKYTYYLSRSSPNPHKLVAVAVDDYSLRMISGRWPWKRSLYAGLIDTVSGLGADTIAFDFIFSGASEDPGEDAALRRAIGQSKARVLLAYGIDVGKGELLAPAEAIGDAGSRGLLNSPRDPDEMTRRLRSFITLDNQFHFSLSVQAAALMQRKPPSEIVGRIPFLADKTYLVNFLAKPGDPSITGISFYDLLTNAGELKKRFGDDFLSGAFVLVYPQAEVLHDYSFTPVGKMPGGYVHLNGVMDILQGKTLRQDPLIPVILVAALFAALYGVFGRLGPFSSLALCAGFLLTGFWLQVLLRLRGIAFSLFPAVVFTALFAAFFFSWKYLYFLSRFLRIQSKVTLDPLKGLFTYRYFCYRLELERDILRFSSNCRLFLVRLDGMGSALKDLDFAGRKKVWEKLKDDCAFKNSYWSAVSTEEIVGCVHMAGAGAEAELEGLRNRILRTLDSMGLVCAVRCGCAGFNRDWQPAEAVISLFEQLKKGQEEIVVFKAEAAVPSALKRQPRERAGFLEGLDEDIEEKNRQLVAALANLDKEYTKTREVFFEVISSLVNALEARDPYTRGHSQRVANYSTVLAERLGWGREEVDKLRKAALLHDLGKIGIADQVLHKKGKLTDEEFEIIKQHEIIGVKILEPIREFNEILPWILHHHEKWNGGGYPHGLAGDAIPAASQIISLADVCDALLTGRDYKLALSFEDTIAELERCKGSAFNPRLTDVFVSILKEQRGKNNLLFKSDMLE